jgi:hypothetical protein
VKRWYALALSLILIQLGCSALLSNREEYVAYRRTRTAAGLEARLVASQSYLDSYRGGRYRARVQRWFDALEPRYFATARESRRGLERYLTTLPRGPHAAHARERLAELDLARRNEQRREQRLTEEARRVEEKLADAAAMREAILRQVSQWSARLAAIRSFGEPQAALGAAFLTPYQSAEPKLRCTPERCAKTFSFPYAIPADKKLVARRAIFDVTLDLEDDTVQRAVLGGPELWSRVGEAAGLAPVRPSDALARTEAISRAVVLVGGAIEAALPNARCAAPSVGLDVLVRRCDGVTFKLIAAPDANEDDRVVIEPSPPLADGGAPADALSACSDGGASGACP